MKKKTMIVTCILIFTIGFIIFLVSNQNALAIQDEDAIYFEDYTNRYELSAREYKILLKPKKFSDAADGASEYWNIVEDLAKKMKIKIEKNSDSEKYDTRYVHYLDTPEHDINKTGYIIRVRKWKGDKKFELSLKFRSKNKEMASQADVAMIDYYEPDIKFEEDLSILGTDFNLIPVFSLRNRTKVLKQIPGKKLKKFAELFPVLSDINVDTDKKILPVNDMIITEKTFYPGVLDFGNDIKCEASISIWKLSESDRGKKFLAEFSFKNKNYNDLVNTEINPKIKKFFLELNKESKNWKALGTTKTSMVYAEK